MAKEAVIWESCPLCLPLTGWVSLPPCIPQPRLLTSLLCPDHLGVGVSAFLGVLRRMKIPLLEPQVSVEDALHCPIILAEVGLPDLCSQKCVIIQNRKVERGVERHN